LKQRKARDCKGFVYFRALFNATVKWHVFGHWGLNNHLYMKLFFTLAFSLLVVSLSAIKPLSGLDEVISALRSGNATELARYVDDNIEISLPDKSDGYSKAQAVIILQTFFNNNGVRGFAVTHKGDNGGSQFCIGTLQTKSGNYRTTVFMKTKNGRQLVKEIRFQPM
jgi:hypothetical protein